MRSTSVLLFVVSVLLMGSVLPEAEARNRRICEGNFYDGQNYPCGGHLQPTCESGAACDAGHTVYNGDGFPLTINCPRIETCTIFGCILIEDIPDEVIPSGCFNQIPTCNNCGGHLQPPCPASAEPICGGCDEGHQLNPNLGLCQLPGAPGLSCDVISGCGNGLLCDGELGQCLPPPGEAGSACNPLMPCADGYTCTTSFECAHEPFALEGDTCDGILTTCADGLFCDTTTFPRRCVEPLRKPGESCNNGIECGADATCSFAVTQGGQIEQQCHPKFDPIFNGFSISPEQCEAFYSAEVAASVTDGAITRAGGGGVVAIVGTAFSVGVAYGGNGEYGCFSAACVGVDTDVAIEAFASSGSYISYGDIAGTSATLVAEAQIPFSPVNVFTVDITNDVEDIGQEYGTALGGGLSPIPVAAGVYSCETDLMTLYSPTQGGASAPEPDPVGPPELPKLGFGALQFDGGDDRLDVNDAAALAVSSGLTAEAWVRVTQAQQDVTIMEKAGQWRLALSDGKLAVQLTTVSPGWSALQVAEDAVLDDLRWHHVALVVTADDRAAIYVDGALAFDWAIVGAITDQTPTDQRFVLGGGINTSGFAGFVDQVRLWSVARSRAELIALMNAPASAAATGLLASWPFDEQNDEIFIDESDNAVTLQAASADAQPARVSEDRGVLGGALNFDGLNDHVNFESDALGNVLEMSDAVTLEAWVRPDGPGGSNAGGIIAGKEGEYYIARSTNGSVFYALANLSPGWVGVSTDVFLEESQWHHIALAYSASAGTVTVFKDGELAQTLSASGALGDFHPLQNDFRIGGRQRDDDVATGKLVFDGLIDEVRVWRSARTPQQISDYFDVALAPDDHPDLAAYWRLDEVVGGIAFDTQSNARHGRLGNGLAWFSPSRSNAAIYADYPRTLLAPSCNDARCQADFDRDGATDYVDNCLTVANSAQVDADGDGFGNLCDSDFNNDCVVNFVDLGELRVAFFGDDDNYDLNADGTVNFIDLGLFRSAFFGQPGPSAQALECTP